MAVVDKTVKVSQEMDMVMGKLVDAVRVMKAAVKSGGFLPEFQAAMQVIISDIMPSLNAIQALSAEEKEDLASFARAVELGGVELVREILA
jgi:hypothetical protein